MHGGVDCSIHGCRGCALRVKDGVILYGGLESESDGGRFEAAAMSKRGTLLHDILGGAMARLKAGRRKPACQ